MSRILTMSIAVTVMFFGLAQERRAVAAEAEGGRPACHEADGTPVGGYFYRDFYTGWKAFTYSVERISDAVAEKHASEILTHAERICRFTEGLRKFAVHLDADERKQLMIELELSNGVSSALQKAVAANDDAKLSDLLRQLNSIQERASQFVPQCWLSIASTFRGKSQIACL